MGAVAQGLKMSDTTRCGNRISTKTRNLASNPLTPLPWLDIIAVREEQPRPTYDANIVT